MKFKLTNNEDLVLEKNSESINVILTLKTLSDWNQTTTTAVDYIKNKPTVNNATITIKKNNTTIDSFTTNQSSNKSINITVPTNSDIASIADNEISNLRDFMYTGAVFKDLDSLISTMNSNPAIFFTKEYVFLSGISKDRYFPNSVNSFGLPSNNAGILSIRLGEFINTYFTENDWLVLKLVGDNKFIILSIIPSTYLSRNNESLLPKNLILNETREICLPVQRSKFNDGNVVLTIYNDNDNENQSVYYDSSIISSVNFKIIDDHFVFNSDYKIKLFVFNDNDNPSIGWNSNIDCSLGARASDCFTLLVHDFGSDSPYSFYVILLAENPYVLCKLLLGDGVIELSSPLEESTDKIIEKSLIFYLKSSSDGVNGELLDVSLFGNGFYCHPTVRYINDTYLMYTNLTKTDLQNILYCTIKYSFKKLYNNDELLFILYSEYPTLMEKAVLRGFYVTNNNLYIKVKYAPINTTLEHSGTNEYHIDNVVGNCVYLVLDEFQTLLDIISYNYIHNNNGFTNLSPISDYYNNEINTNKSKNLRFYLCEISSENGVNRIAYTKQYIKFDSNTNLIELVNIPENTNN